MSGTRLSSLSIKAYRILLQVYPAQYRREYGALMLQLFRDQVRDAYCRNGVQGIARVWAHTLWDLLVTAVKEHTMATPKARLFRAALCLLTGFTVLCVSVWALRIPPHTALRAGKGVSAVAVSPDGHTIVAGTLWGGMHVWDTNTGPPQHRSVAFDPSLIYSLAFSPDGRLWASSTPCGPLGCVQLWDATTGELVRTIEGHARGVQIIDREGQVQVQNVPGDAGDVRFSPDGRLLASAGSDGAIELWDISTGQLVRVIYGHDKTPVQGIAFSPDGRTLAASQKDMVSLWDVSSGDLERVIQAHADFVGRVVFSPDGHTLASGGADQVTRLWNVHTGELEQRLAQDSHITSLAFSPDGQILASGGGDNRVWLWDLASGQRLRTYRGHRWDPFDNGVSTLAFCADGHTLVSGGEDGRVVLWDLSEG